MKRGILELTKEEFSSMMMVININNINHEVLKAKLLSVKDIQLIPVRIELSEEELEVLADEIGMPFNDADINLKNARDKIGEMILNFRSII